MSNSTAADSSHGHILVVEDDLSVRLLLEQTLKDAGYRCTAVADGVVGLQAALENAFDLIVLDVNLPRLSGLDICDEIRKRDQSVPVIMLTARGAESEVVAGLEKGADDYVAKPFRPLELLARIRTRLKEQRRKTIASATGASSAKMGEVSLIEIGNLALDIDRMRLTRDGELVELSAREFDFLLLLASHPGRPLSREVILETLWGCSSEAYKPNISVFVSRLRRKIEADPDQPKYLLTVFGVGYRFVEAAELTAAEA